MKLKISNGNTKLGKIPSISMPPGLSCIDCAPCLTEGCYAMKAFRQYPAVRKAWTSNFEFWTNDSDKFFDEFNTWLKKNKPERFRLFVGGDLPDEKFLEEMILMTRLHPDTSFLVYTKRYEYDYSGKPDNLQVVLSTWPGVPLPTNTDLPWAWLEEDARRRKSYPHFVCPGGCSDTCNFSCWDKLDSKTHVAFPRH